MSLDYLKPIPNGISPIIEERIPSMMLASHFYLNIQFG
jgi:hypothetical protein